MQPYRHEYTVTDAHVDCFGRLRPSMLLFYCQDVAGHHCLMLGTDSDSLARKNLLWAIIRQRVQITRLPRTGETIQVHTWPMPTTRTCYPRSTVAYDSQGNELFRAVSMWVLMDVESRAMVLPGKSGVTVEGIITGTELKTPGSLAPRQMANTVLRRVGYTELDRNGHMNNTKYLDWVDDLLPSAYHRENVAREFTICYHMEAREGDVLNLNWQLDEEGLMQVESLRENQEGNEFHRIFSAKVMYENSVL